MVLNRCIFSFLTRRTLVLFESFDLWKTFNQWPFSEPLPQVEASVMDAFRVMETEYRMMTDDRPLTGNQLTLILKQMFGGKP